MSLDDDEHETRDVLIGMGLGVLFIGLHLAWRWLSGGWPGGGP